MARNRNKQDFDDFMLDEDTQEVSQYSPKRGNKNTKLNNDFISLDEDQPEYQGLKLPVIKQDKLTLPNKPSSKHKDSKRQQTEENQYFEQLASDKPSNKVQPNRQDEEEDYGNDFEEDVYESEDNFKSKQTQKKVYEYQSQKQPAKTAQIRTNPANKSSNYGNNMVRPKQQSLYKSSSKSNIPFQRTNLSLQKGSPNNKDEDKKFSLDVSRNFPETDVSKQSEEQIDKLNEKVRIMIRKLNNQLNDILNRVTLEQKKPQPAKKNIDEVIKVMVETKKNNQKILDRGYTELKKLSGRAGSIKGDGYEEEITVQVATLAEKKKELEKAITQMKADININEKKSSAVSKKNIEVLKSDLFNLKKDVEKHESKENQLKAKLKQITEKHGGAEKKHRDVVYQANDKGISIASTAGNIAKQKQLEDKEKILKKGIDSIEVLYKSKGDIMNSENQRIKRDIVNCEAEIKDLYSQIVELAGKSALLIEKEKENPKLMKNVLNSLEAFSRSIANPPGLDFVNTEQRQIVSPSPFASKNKNRIENESDRQKSPSKLQKRPNEQKNTLKPNFKKDRPSEERAPKEEENKDKEHQTPKVIQEVQQEVEKTKTVVNNLKPTFNFRKRGQSKSEIDKDKEQQSVSSTPVPQSTQPIPTEPEKVMKPFTRFRKNSANQEGTYNLTQPQQKQPEKPKQQPVEETQPKKFMLRRRGQNNDGSESGYNPSVGNKLDTSQQGSQRSIETRQNKDEPSLPAYKPSNEASYNYQATQEVLPPRNRNVSTNNKPAEPTVRQQTTQTQPIQPKQREGRLKKQKINIEAEKIKNIYSQAEDLTNEFMVQSPKKVVKQEEELDLNRLIGNKNARKNEDDDLAFNEKRVSKETKPKGGKQDDFFGFDL